MMCNIKNLLVILCGIASCNAVQTNNDHNFNNQFNNSINNTNIEEFYKNTNKIKQYLNSKIKNINNNSMQLNYDNIDQTDLDLFEYNINHFPSAKTNITACLNSLISDNISNDQILHQKISCIIYICSNRQNLNKLLDPNQHMSFDEQSLMLIKKLIIGVNVGTILFNEENKKTSNDISNIHPILLLDGNDQCWFNATLQLINSAIECAPKKVLANLINKPGYVLVEFLNYLKQESKTFFEDYNKKHVLNKSSKADTDGLLLYNKFQEFEKTLSDKQLADWKILPGVEKGKEIMKKINEWPGGRPGTCPTAMAILSKMFPEVNDLFYHNWENVSSEQFDSSDFCLFEFSTMNLGVGLDRIPQSVNPYFLLTYEECYNNTLQQQITNNQWRIGFDNNDNFVIYTVRGLHLIAPGLKAKIGNGSAHAALDNSSNNWYFSDSEGYNSNPSDNLDVFAPATNEHIKNSGYPKFDPSKMQVQAFMYRKMTNEEIMQYMQ